MGQLNWIDGDGWYQVVGASSLRAHYFTADEGQHDFPISLCKKFFSGDIHPLGAEDLPKCKTCARLLKAT